MNPGAPSGLSAHLSPDFSPLHPPSVIHNNRILSSITTLSACFSGLVAGVLGLTDCTGFMLYVLSAAATAVVTGAVKCRFDVGRYVPGGQGHGSVRAGEWKGWWALMGLGQENFLGFLLFWIGSFALIHVYD